MTMDVEMLGPTGFLGVVEDAFLIIICCCRCSRPVTVLFSEKRICIFLEDDYNYFAPVNAVKKLRGAYAELARKVLHIFSLSYVSDLNHMCNNH